MNSLICIFSDGILNEWTVDVDRRIYKGIQVGMDRGFIKSGDPVVVVSGKITHLLTINLLGFLNGINHCPFFWNPILSFLKDIKIRI